MGLFGNIARQARLAPAKFNYGFAADELRKKGFNMPEGKDVYDITEFGNAVVNDNQGYAAGILKRDYGYNTKEAKNIEDIAFKRAVIHDRDGNPVKTGEKGYRDQGYNLTVKPALPTAPGFSSTNIKINGPNQVEQIAAGMRNSPSKKQSNDQRVAMGDKDMRSALAEEKLRIVDEFQAAAGGAPLSFSEKVDVLNSGFQNNDSVLEAFQNDPAMQKILNAGETGQFVRPVYESENFVGEGQFGRVSELAPGYVIKEQAPLVEWGGYTEPGSNKGNLVGRVFDYRDVAKDVSQMNHLNKMHMGPKVEAFNIANDGSTEVIMRDLRDNFETGETFYDRLNETQTPQDFLDARLFNVKRAQQEAASAHSGLLLGDRHDNNVMRNTLTGRPIQIDPSGVYLEPGATRDEQVAIKALDAINAAGLQEEGEIYAGLFNEARDRGDLDAIHSLAQQGLAMAQKIKHIPTNYSRAFTPTDDIPF